MYKRVYLKRGKEESLRRFHPWIFSGAISHTDEGIADGDLVSVITSSGDIIATGHYQHGTITVRVLAFADEDINMDFWRRRLRSALEMRKAIGLADSEQTDTFRLVHGEGDNLPGLVIDCYGRTAVMQAHSVGMHRCRKQISQALVDVMGPRLEAVYYKSETTLKGMEPADGYLHPALTTPNVGLNNAEDNAENVEATAKENGLRFIVDWEHGQKTGFFVDQRDNRSLVEHYAHGRRVLNMFCYTGGFSVYAMRGGATLVHSVDSSSTAIDLARHNIELNFPGDLRHTAFCEDAFAFLDQHLPQAQATPDKGRTPYDLVILDPPAFAKHRSALTNALRGYTRLNAKGMRLVKPGGLLFTFSCSQVVTKDQFRAAVFTAATLAHRNVRILHQLHQPADHPINIYHPEGEYLKGLVLYVE